MNTPVTHFPPARKLPPVQLSQVLQGVQQDSAAETPGAFPPVFRDNTVSVITPVPSQDSTQIEAPNFDRDGNFGLLRSRTPSQEWDNYSESPSFICDQEWARQRLRTSTDNAILD